jgi:uncharacterized protein (TIGR02265 family)
MLPTVTSAAAPSSTDFQEIDWDAPLDMDAQLQATPIEVFVKGMSINAVLDAVERQGRAPLTTPRVSAFRDQPMRDLVSLLVQAPSAAYPDVSARRALRAIGHDHFRGLLDNMIFRVIFAGFGGTLGVERAVRLAPKAYSVAAAHERVAVIEQSEGRVVLSYDDVWTFPDCFQVGLVEGALEVLGAKAGRVRVRRRGFAAADLEVCWSPGGQRTPAG